MASYSEESFDVIAQTSSRGIYEQYEDLHSGKITDGDVQIHKFLRSQYPELTITAIPTNNLPLLQYASLGFATAELDTETDSVLRWRGYVPPAHRGSPGQLGDAFFFAKYHYQSAGEDFLLYTIGGAGTQVQYLLKEPDSSAGETTLSHCAKTDKLINAAVTVLVGDANQFVYVFDGYWQRSKELWREIQKADWDKVILDEKFKRNLKETSNTFFDNEEIYKKYGVPWKRGLLFTGPPGNGKTISIKALMKTLYGRKDATVPTLYVKAASETYQLGAVFAQARKMTPCLLVMEDIETIVTARTRSYFFNELDGLANNGGLLIVATTNYANRLDPGLSSRPSRFDRKFYFDLPNHEERIMYAEMWRHRLEKLHSDIDFPQKLSPAIADITDQFSFAYLQEAFVATLLVLAREGDEEADSHTVADSINRPALQNSTQFYKSEDLTKYKFWRVLKEEVKSLRNSMGDEKPSQSANDQVEVEHLASSLQKPSAPNPAIFDTEWHQALPVGASQSSSASPTLADLSRAGLQKDQYFAEHAYEWK